MSEATLAKKLVRPAQIGYVPFMQQRDRFFLLANLDFLPEMQSRADLTKECLAVVRLILKSNFLSDEAGVEVSAWGHLAEFTGRNRLIRLSVGASAYLAAAVIEIDDLLTDKHSGIRCRFPILKSPQISP